ncbi:MAG: flotillin family protein [Myxococcota bacterium]
MNVLQAIDIPTGWAVAIPAMVVGVVWVVLATVRALVHICPPNQILIFSGRSHAAADGREVGFRVVFGGRTFRVPVLERVDHMDMSLLSVPMTVNGAYSLGGIPLSVHAIANVKVSSDPKVVNNAIERFLGHDRSAIGRVAKETLEGHLRGVLANMTPEEVNEDRLKFADRLSDEAEPDLRKLGLQLDTLKIQHVSDEREYLDSIGRKRIAEVLRTAEVAESDAKRAAEETEAAASARGKVAKTQAEANVLRRRNALRQLTADLEAQAKSEEVRAQAAAQQARAEAEKELQGVRAELERLRLAADVTIPAEVAQRVRELEAAGQAASIAENGKAMAESIAAVAKAWKATDGKAMDMYVLQNLEELFAQVSAAAAQLEVKKVSLLDAGDGTTLANYVSAYPATVGALLREVSKTLGVDIPAVLTGKTS